MARKRILEILSACDVEGTWRQCTQLAVQLPTQEFDVQLCLLARDHRDVALLEKTGLIVQAVGSGRKIDPWILWPLVQLIKKWNPDLVHSWDCITNVYGPLAAHIAGVQTIFCNVWEPANQKNEWKNYVDRFLKNRVNKIIVPSRVLCDSDDTLRNQKDGAVDIIPPGLPLPVETTIERENLLRKLQLPENSRLIAIVDQMHSGNRLRDAIWATELLKVAGHNVQVFIFGKGPRRKSLEQFRNRVQLEDHIQFLDDYDLIGELMGHLDIYWRLGGHRGNSSIPIIEAMRRAIPVIADASVNHRELLEHEKTGILVPCGDPASLASWTQHLLENPAQSKRIGAMGRSAVENQYDPEITISAMTQLYKQSL
jgi:glycosyltransferase involved in cell wall biosynthesis